MNINFNWNEKMDVYMIIIKLYVILYNMNACTQRYEINADLLIRWLRALLL